MNKEELKQIYLMNAFLKMILKKVYNLSDTQYQRVIKAFEKDADKGVEEYLNGVGVRGYL